MAKTVTKEEALHVLGLEGKSPSALNIQKNFQKLALEWHPAKCGATLRSLERFDKLCRSYIILSEGREAMTSYLSLDEMLNVFIKAFELEDMHFNKEVYSVDACTQCDEKRSITTGVQTSWAQFSGTKSTATTRAAAAVGATISNGATASAEYIASVGACTQCEKKLRFSVGVQVSLAQFSGTESTATTRAAAAAVGATISNGATTSAEYIASVGTCTQCEKKLRISTGVQVSLPQFSGTKSTATTRSAAAVGATISNGATASAEDIAFVGTGASVVTSKSTETSVSVGTGTSIGIGTFIGTSTSFRTGAPVGTITCIGAAASVGPITFNRATTTAATCATAKKPAVPEKAKQNVPAVAVTSLEEKSEGKKKKASKKSRKRRQRREKQQLSKASKTDSSWSLEDEETDDNEDELDPNSAFVAMALSRTVKGAAPKLTASSGGAIPKTPKKSAEDVIAWSRNLAREGYEMCNLKRYKDAIELFTQAIKLYAQDHSYFGNRSYCYSILGKYKKALKDAEKAISLKPEQAKGYFRRAKAQFGLEKYNEAAESFRKVLEIDPTCLEAQDDLYRAQFFEIVSMGFTMEQAEWSLAHGNGNVWTAVNLLCGPDSAVPDVKKNPCNMDGAHSQQLWVGNLKPGVTLMMLSDLFERYGGVCIRVLHDRHCAYINYPNRLSAGKAMKALQGYMLCGSPLLIRFADDDVVENGPKEDGVTVLRKSSLKNLAEEDKSASSERKGKMSGPVNGNECYFWRTSGCSFGVNCYYEHIPSHKGIDWKAPRSTGKFK